MDHSVDPRTGTDDEATSATEGAPASDAGDPEPAEPERTGPKPEEKPAEAPQKDGANAAADGFTGDAALLDEPDPWD